MIKYLCFIATVFCITIGFSQNPERKYIHHTQNNAGLEVQVTDGIYVFRYFTPEIVEVSFYPSEEEIRSAYSHAVVAKPLDVELKITENNESLSLTTKGISIQIHKHPLQLEFYYENTKLIAEKNGYTPIKSGLQIDFHIEEAELLMGGGARALGMNRRGHKLELYNKAHYGYETKSDLMNYTIPMVLSSKKYALHFDNPVVGHLDFDSSKDNTLTFQAESGPKRYQLITGKDWPEIIKNYTFLTGRQPLPPLWAFGNFASRFGYHSQEEIENTIRKFREASIPVDAVVLDLYWFGHHIKGTMGNLEFVKDSFPNPKKMIADLKKDGVKTILITEPFVLTSSNRWEEAVYEEILATDTLGNPATYDFYFGNTGLIDVFKPEGKKWFWNIYAHLKTYGIAGWWGDLGEPEVHPSFVKHHTGSANEVHNIYGHQWAKIIFKGYQQHFPEERPFILMRSGYSGSQRLGMIPWSGDVNRSWGGLKPQTEIALQMGLQGLAYMHSDLGGFAGANLDDELYVRWLQYGVFQPVFRPHAQEEVASEPVFRSPKAMALSKKAIELRYRLLPYIYTMAFDNNQTGIPLMRPLFFEEPDNFYLYHIAATYLWGNDILISPVVRPQLKKQQVYFPATSNWFDFYTGQKIAGGQTRYIETQEDYIPTFVRGGAFIPMVRLVQTTDNYDVDNLEIHYYNDDTLQQSNGKIYHDDGKTKNAYENGNYEILHAESKRESNTLFILLKKETGNTFYTAFQEIQIFIHHIEKKVKNVKINGKKHPFTYNKEKAILSLKDLTLEDIETEIKLTF